MQKNERFSLSFTFFAKERCDLCVLLRSLRSFTFFAKQRNVLHVLFRSFKKNGKERSVLLGLISCQKLKKRMGKNGKEQNILNGKEFGAQPCICLLCKRLLKGQCHTLFLNMLHFYEQAKFHQDIQNLSICVVSNFSHFLRISSVVQYYVLY